MAQFVDECNIHVKAGDGGAGAVAFRREAHVPKGGPDGGDGGKGGDVWLVADRNVASLYSFQDHPFRRADDGAHGKGKRQHGRSGADREVKVPVGTVVLDRSGEVLADLVNEGDSYMAAEGGRGGQGNARFLSNKRRVPGFAEQGEVGDEFWRRLELKLVADVALVGFPNVGKSTLISRISAARPKIADYPFTTLVPNLGVVRLGGGSGDDELEYVVADVPGVIEGASEGRGLGHQFLRHVERARVLCVLLDLAGEQSGSAMIGLSPQAQLEALLEELDAYQPDLLDRARVVIGSRADLADPDDNPDDLVRTGPPLEDWERDAPSADAGVAGDSDEFRVDAVVSSVTGAGVQKLKGVLGDAVRDARKTLAAPTQFVVHRPVPEDISVERDGPVWVVHGREARRAVALSDLTRHDALAEAHRRLRSLGVDRALARAGAQPGDPVLIGDLELEYSDDDLY